NDAGDDRCSDRGQRRRRGGTDRAAGGEDPRPGPRARGRGGGGRRERPARGPRRDRDGTDAEDEDTTRHAGREAPKAADRHARGERDGRLLFERYYRGAARSGRLDVFSVTKSVTATLVGIALHVGMVRSLDQRLGEFFPKDVQHARDKRVRKITLRHLLTMTSGYRDVAAVRSDDWIHTQIDRPLAEDPGRGWAYDNGSFHLLSAVLTKATGRPANAYAQRVLFGPLGIARTKWATDGQGH